MVVCIEQYQTSWSTYMLLSICNIQHTNCFHIDQLYRSIQKSRLNDFTIIFLHYWLSNEDNGSIIKHLLKSERFWLAAVAFWTSHYIFQIFSVIKNKLSVILKNETIIICQLEAYGSKRFATQSSENDDATTFNVSVFVYHVFEQIQCILNLQQICYSSGVISWFRTRKKIVRLIFLIFLCSSLELQIIPVFFFDFKFDFEKKFLYILEW